MEHSASSSEHHRQQQSTNRSNNHNLRDGIFERLRDRLSKLELWWELAIRPAREEDCDENDLDLWRSEHDDCTALLQRCLSVRKLMNENLPIKPQETESAYCSSLVIRSSSIPNSGLGLFYEPSKSAFNDAENKGHFTIPPGETVCLYYGHIHNFHSAKLLQDKRYLMFVQGNVLVDPAPLPEIKARYINDPLNDCYINCKYVPQEFESAVVSTRAIQPNEELFVSYGDSYWAQQDCTGRVKA